MLQEKGVGNWVVTGACFPLAVRPDLHLLLYIEKIIAFYIEDTQQFVVPGNVPCVVDTNTEWTFQHDDTVIGDSSVSGPSRRPASVASLPAQESSALADLLVMELSKPISFGRARGILVTGVAGVGKTALALQVTSWLAASRDYRVEQLAVPLLLSMAKRGPQQLDAFLRKFFEQLGSAEAGPPKAGARPTILIIDEMDGLAPSRESGADAAEGATSFASMGHRQLAGRQLAHYLGALRNDLRVCVLGIVCEARQLGPLFLAPGRFEVELNIGPPQPG